MKLTNVLVATFMMSFCLVSCNKATEKQENKTEQTVEKPAEMPVEKGVLAKAEFVCSMDCEKGKVYEVAGKCPTCKMDLIDKKNKVETKPTEKEHGHSHGEHGHSH